MLLSGLTLPSTLTLLSGLTLPPTLPLTLTLALTGWLPVSSRRRRCTLRPERPAPQRRPRIDRDETSIHTAIQMAA